MSAKKEQVNAGREGEHAECSIDAGGSGAVHPTLCKHSGAVEEEVGVCRVRLERSVERRRRGSKSPKAFQNKACACPCFEIRGVRTRGASVPVMLSQVLRSVE